MSLEKWQAYREKTDYEIKLNGFRRKMHEVKYASENALIRKLEVMATTFREENQGAYDFHEFSEACAAMGIEVVIEFDWNQDVRN